MKKIIGTLSLAILVIGTVFGPSLVKANLESEMDLSQLEPTAQAVSAQSKTTIHPSWKKLGLIPGCDH